MTYFENTTLNENDLAIWTKVLRKTQNLSQQALATASNLSHRTIQRIENGESSNIQTRRSLASGLGYKDNTVFVDASKAHTIAEFVANLVKENKLALLKEVKEQYPDCIIVEVKKVKTGKELAKISSTSDYFVVEFEDEISENIRMSANQLLDVYRDWGDIFSELTHNERYDAEKSLNILLNELHDTKGQLYIGVKKLTMGTEAPHNSLLSIAYILIGKSNTASTKQVLVPKKIKF